MTREERAAHSKRVAKHYMSGTWHGQSTAGTIYVLATVLERVDNEFLWCALFQVPPNIPLIIPTG